MNHKTKKHSDRKLLFRSFQYIYPYKLKFTLAIICILSSIGTNLLGPLIWGKVLEELFRNKWKNCVCYILLTLSLELISIVIFYVQSYVFAYLNQNVIKDIKSDIFKAMLELPTKAYDEIDNGEFISRLHGDAERVANMLTERFITMLVDIFRLLGIGIASVLVSYKLAFIIFCSFPLTYYISANYGKKIREEHRVLADENDNFYSVSSEAIWGIREIKVFGLKKNRMHDFIDRADKLKTLEIKVTLLNAMSEFLCNAVIIIARIGVMVLGAYFVVNKILKISHYIAFISYTGQMANALLGVSHINLNIQDVMTALERIYKLIDGGMYTFEAYGDLEVKGVQGKVEFKNVTFGYDGEHEVLHHITFSIPAKKRTAFVGSSGSGKTTIFNLILKLYEPNQGSILIDDTEIRNVSENWLRKNLGVVSQDPFLFSMSIRDNLLLVNPEATSKELEDVCQKAYLHDFIVGLPEKYDTVLGENGVTLSGGQKQRLAIARILLRKPQIILFDEATSALDNESQGYIQKAMEAISEESTVITIAHRLSTIIESDIIYVMNEGRIVGSGTHHYLIEHNDIYKKLYQADVGIIHNNQEETS